MSRFHCHIRTGSPHLNFTLGEGQAIIAKKEEECSDKGKGDEDDEDEDECLSKDGGEGKGDGFDVGEGKDDGFDEGEDYSEGEEFDDTGMGGLLSADHSVMFAGISPSFCVSECDSSVGAAVFDPPDTPFKDYLKSLQS